MYVGRYIPTYALARERREVGAAPECSNSSSSSGSDEPSRRQSFTAAPPEQTSRVFYARGDVTPRERVTLFTPPRRESARSVVVAVVPGPDQGSLFFKIQFAAPRLFPPPPPLPHRGQCAVCRGVCVLSTRRSQPGKTPLQDDPRASSGALLQHRTRYRYVIHAPAPPGSTAISSDFYACNK